MPKMTHWNSPDPIYVAPAKAGVYRAQGWVAADRRVEPSAVTAVTRASVDPVEAVEPEAAPAPAKKAAKKPAKRAAKKA